MIRIAALSDIHLETRRPDAGAFGEAMRRQGRPRLALGPDITGLAGRVDLVVLAGDVGHGIAALCADRSEPGDSASTIGYADDLARFLGVPVAVVPGNHEFWRGGSIERVRETMAEAAARTQGRVHLLDRSVATPDVAGRPLRLVGAVLWTDFELFGPERRQMEMATAFSAMNDYKKITRRAGRWRPEDARREHLLDREFLSRALAEPFEGDTVVVTHHVPSRRLLPETLDQYSASYGSAIDGLVGASGAALWVAGHSHVDAQARLGGTLLVNRPVGYPRETIRRPWGAGFRPAEILLAAGEARLLETVP
jgi:hypothetical protein